MAGNRRIREKRSIYERVSAQIILIRLRVLFHALREILQDTRFEFTRSWPLSVGEASMSLDLATEAEHISVPLVVEISP